MAGKKGASGRRSYAGRGVANWNEMIDRLVRERDRTAAAVVSLDRTIEACRKARDAAGETVLLTHPEAICRQMPTPERMLIIKNMYPNEPIEDIIAACECLTGPLPVTRAHIVYGAGIAGVRRSDAFKQQQQRDKIAKLHAGREEKRTKI